MESDLNISQALSPKRIKQSAYMIDVSNKWLEASKCEREKVWNELWIFRLFLEAFAGVSVK